MPNLKIDSVQAGYGDIQVLWDLSFEVGEGQIVSLIGSNGAGKTTTLKSIAGLIRPVSGTISFDGTTLTKIPVERIVEKGVVYVPQGREIFPDMTVLENLQMGSYTKRARQYHSDNLKKVYSLFPALESKRKEMAGTLSGGQAQMLAIGRGMMANPKLLLLDEPSAGISPKLADSIFDSIQKLRAQGITILLVEQDAGRSLEMSDFGYVLENGRIAESGKAKELLDNAHVRQAYLGM
ncbi:MAG: ABC transporter ATP-binding protein [archaeon]|nr:ABC transporter ATP-binding protein [archaeon]